MFRLFFLTFYGKERASHDVMHHIHESPKSMAVPLIVLAVLSVVGGFMNVPESLFGSAWLSEFLAPVVAQSTALREAHHLSHATEYMLMGVVITFTVVIIGFAYSRYVSKNHVPVAGEESSGLQRTLYNKYYVDEHYEAFIVKPLYWISGKLDVVMERLAIDKLVNTVGASVVLGSRGLRFLQNGGIGFYIFIMVMSIILILTISVIR